MAVGHRLGLMAAGALLAGLLAGSARAAEPPLPTGDWSGPGTWAFEPGQRVEGGRLDLRTLNEPVAGEHGFVRLSDDSNGFVRGDGQPIRFWGVAGHTNAKVSDADLALHARFLARMGVNMVRIGGANPGLMPQEQDAALDEPNEAFMDEVWRAVAAMKKEGIYTRLSPFWDHGSIKYINPDWGLEGYASGDTLNGLLFFEPHLQQAYKAWMKRMMTEPNPYTGVALKDEPALAIVQIVSEDSLMFWWLDKIKGGPRRELERQFARFAADKHGSIAAALEAWNGSAVEGDAAAEGRLGLYPLYNLTQWPGVGHPQRLADQVAFLARTEHDFYAEMKRYLRDELGVRQVVGPSNFHSADAVRLDDLQRWAWTAGDVIELNQFYGGLHQGNSSAWRISAGQFYQPRSAVFDPAIPEVRKQVAGMPFILSSTVWLLPDDYTAEGPMMGAAYAAAIGIDGLLWFAANAPTYDLSPYMSWATIQGSHPMPKWSLSHPGFLSQFPAAALVYRRGLVAPAETVVHEVRSMEGLLARRAPLLTESLDYVPGDHADEAAPAKRPLMQTVRPEAYLVGRVEVAFGGDPAESRAMDVSPFIDEATGEIRTTTGQLSLDTQQGLWRINAPAVQGVTGFLARAGGRFELEDVTITSGNEYASIVLVSMDDQPLSRSRRVLVQVGTQARPTGWQTKPATRTDKAGQKLGGLEIVSTGSMPWRVRDTDATVTLANPALRRAVRLDAMGFTAEEVPVEASDGAVTVTLPPDTMYLVLHAEGSSGPAGEEPSSEEGAP